MVNEIRQQPYSESFNCSARLVSRLVLVKAQIRVSRGLPYIQAPPPHSTRVVQQDHVYRMVGAPLSRSRGVEGSGDPLSFTHPVGAVHLNQNLEARATVNNTLIADARSAFDSLRTLGLTPATIIFQ